MPDADDLTDEEITDRVASEVAERIRARHPNTSPSFRRKLVRLYTLQAVGLASPSGQITDVELGQHLGRDPRRISEDAARAIERLKADPRARDLARAYLSHLKLERGL